MSGYRRAAVAIHGLEPSDQRWILAELPESDRSALTGYLDELTSLGFTNEAFVRDGLASMHAGGTTGSKPIERIAHAKPLQMLAVLEGEPSSLIAQLLSLREWPWKAGFLKLLTPLRRERIRSLLSNDWHATEARKNFLLVGIAKHLQEYVDEEAATVTPTKWTQVPGNAARQLIALVQGLFARMTSSSWQR